MNDERTIQSFEDLMVFRRAYQISLEVHRISLQFPRVEQFGLAEQIRRASKSICANVAEGFGKQDRGGGEFRRYLADRGRLGRRDAGVGAVLRRPRLRRGDDRATLARRVPADRPDAAGPASHQSSCGSFVF